MTEFNNNNIKFAPQVPKTYEVRYLEVKEQSNLNKFADYLGIKTVECSGKGKDVSKSTSSTTVVAVPSTQADIVASAIKATAEAGGSVEIKTKSSGATTVNYDSEK